MPEYLEDAARRAHHRSIRAANQGRRNQQQDAEDPHYRDTRATACVASEWPRRLQYTALTPIPLSRCVRAIEVLFAPLTYHHRYRDRYRHRYRDRDRYRHRSRYLLPTEMAHVEHTVSPDKVVTVIEVAPQR